MIKPFCVALFGLLVSLSPSLQAKPDRDSARWVHANAKVLDGKPHSVTARHIRPERISADGQWFWVWTNEEGIFAVCAVDDGPKFIERYEKKRMSGTVRLSNGRAYLDLRPDPDLSAEGVVRTWTARDGRTVEAELVSADRAKVRIRRSSDGEVFEYPRLQLSRDDQAFVDRWLAANR